LFTQEFRDIGTSTDKSAWEIQIAQDDIDTLAEPILAPVYQLIEGLDTIEQFDTEDEWNVYYDRYYTLLGDDYTDTNPNNCYRQFQRSLSKFADNLVYDMFPIYTVFEHESVYSYNMRMISDLYQEFRSGTLRTLQDQVYTVLDSKRPNSN
jgi:hypothetical protein